MLSSVLVTAAVFFIPFYLAYFYLVTARKRDGEPPGPTPLPILGNFVDVARSDPLTYLAMHKLCQRWGKVMTLWMGAKKYVVVAGREEIKALNHDPSFDDRYPPGEEVAMVNVYSGHSATDPHGIIWSSGRVWQGARRFSLRALKDQGFGRSASETVVADETMHMIQHIKTLEGQLVSSHDFLEFLNKVTLNITWQISAGERYEYDSENMVKLFRVLESFTELGMTMMTGPVAAFPSLAHIPPFKGRIAGASLRMEEVRGFLEECILRHKRTFSENNIRDFIDAYLLEQQREGADKKVFNDDQLVTVMLDLFLAGTETASKTLTWASLFMITYPEVQRRVQAELSSVVGPHEQVTAAHRADLPYTDACLQEIWRLGPIAPMGATRYCSRDTLLGGRMVKEGSMVFACLYTSMVDEEWGEAPFEFRPKRHMEEKGTRDKMLLFGVGRRSCLGESLAKLESFVLFANLLHSFNLGDGGKKPPHFSNTVDGLTVMPAPFSLTLEVRKK